MLSEYDYCIELGLKTFHQSGKAIFSSSCPPLPFLFISLFVTPSQGTTFPEA